MATRRELSVFYFGYPLHREIETDFQMERNRGATLCIVHSWVGAGQKSVFCPRSFLGKRSHLVTLELALATCLASRATPDSRGLRSRFLRRHDCGMGCRATYCVGSLSCGADLVMDGTKSRDRQGGSEV